MRCYKPYRRKSYNFIAISNVLCEITESYAHIINIMSIIQYTRTLLMPCSSEY